MMEATSQTSRFIFTAQTPSRLIDALRSRTQHIRLTGVPRKRIESRLAELCSAEGIEPVRGILGDIAHISEGNLRKAIFTTEVLALLELLGQRENLHRLLTMISTNEVQRMIEAALRGQVVEWRWEKDGYKNARKLKGALGIYDEIISKQSLEAEDIVEQVHQVLTGGRLNLPENQLTLALSALSDCDVRLRRSSQGRIQIEQMLHEFAAMKQQ
jgi:DNA polymerase III delta prime subunit